MVKMKFILWKITIKHNFAWKYYAFLFLFFMGVCVYIYIYVSVWSCFDKYISAVTWPLPNKKILAPPLFKYST